MEVDELGDLPGELPGAKRGRCNDVEMFKGAETTLSCKQDNTISP